VSKSALESKLLACLFITLKKNSKINHDGIHLGRPPHRIQRDHAQDDAPQAGRKLVHTSGETAIGESAHDAGQVLRLLRAGRNAKGRRAQGRISEHNSHREHVTALAQGLSGEHLGRSKSKRRGRGSGSYSIGRGKVCQSKARDLDSTTWLYTDPLWAQVLMKQRAAATVVDQRVSVLQSEPKLSADRYRRL